MYRCVRAEIRPVLPELEGYDKREEEEDNSWDEERRGPKGPKRGGKGEEPEEEEEEEEEEGSVPVNVERPISLSTLRARVQRLTVVDPAVFDALPEVSAPSLHHPPTHPPTE